MPEVMLALSAAHFIYLRKAGINFALLFLLWYLAFNAKSGDAFRSNELNSWVTRGSLDCLT